jgi:predicted ribosome quality control (RQC) complex YloA/Tae2 family protein
LALKYGHTHSQQRLKLLKQIAASNYRQKLKKLYRLLGNLENDYHKCEHKLLRERDAELLKSNLYLVKRGIPQIQVADYFEPDMPTRQIDLDPALSPKDNLFRLFHQIKRAKRGIEALTPRISETKNQIQQLEQQLSLIDSISDVDHIADLLPNTPTTTHNSAHCAQSSAQTRNQHLFREFLSNSAQSILVGKDGIGNDFLTFRHARGNDLWLHARGVPGSHIVVPLQRNQQPSNDLLIDAATLAAHFSKARDHSLVDIIYTLVKYVRKPKNALPGQVSILRDNNLSLRLEPERLQRLLASSQLLNSNLHKKQ